MNYKDTESENDRIARLCFEHLDKFTDISGHNVTAPIPKDAKITVYCEGNAEEGFATNTYWDDMGIEAFIAKKWILHSELETLTGQIIP